MIVFLKIVAGCILAILLLVAIVLFLARKWIKNLIAEFHAESGTPLKIHLHENLQPDWLEKKKAANIIAEFERLGFAQGTAYHIEEMPDIDMLSMFNDKYSVTIFSQEKLGVAFDISHVTPENHWFTVTTNRTAGTLNPLPNVEVVMNQEFSPTEALALIQERCGSLESNPITDETYRETVEKFYKEEQVYRWRNGGISYAEFKNSAASLDSKTVNKYSEDQLHEAFIETKRGELNLWEEAGLEEYYESNDIDEDDEIRYGCLFIVPEKTDAEAFIHYLEGFDLVHEDHVDKVAESVRSETDIQALFTRINNARSPNKRAKLHGTITFPVAADIYEAKY